MSKRFTPAETVEAISDLLNEITKRLPPQVLSRLSEKHPIIEAIFEDGLFDIKIEGNEPPDDPIYTY